MKVANKIRQSPKLPAAKRREQLLESAHRLFKQRGYLGTSTEEIARHAGLTKGALYFHFKNKEDILLALLKAIIADHRKVFAALPPGRFTPADFIELTMKVRRRSRLLEFRSVLDIMGQALRIPRIRRFMNAEFKESVRLLAERLHPIYGLTKRESEQMAVMLLSLCDGLSVRRCLDRPSVDMKLQLRILRSFFELVEDRETETSKA